MALRIATRGSALALAQAGQVAEMLGGAELVEVSSDGEPGDKARFVRGVERALLDGEADVGVHSAKDVPAELPEGLVLAAVPPREDPADAWVGAGALARATCPRAPGSGTASLRRRAQLLAARPDLEVGELHGNVDTRLRKLAEERARRDRPRRRRPAPAGPARTRSPSRCPREAMTPAAGQGALLLQIRDGDEAALRGRRADHATSPRCAS